MSHDDALLDEIRALRLAVAAMHLGIVAELRAERRARPRLTPEDRVLLSRLLPCIAGAVGSESFTVAELAQLPAPRCAMKDAGLNAKSVGRLLRRAALAGEAVDELCVERVGSAAAGVGLWQVVGR
jgi:hypothetical protein